MECHGAIALLAYAYEAFSTANNLADERNAGRAISFEQREKLFDLPRGDGEQQAAAGLRISQQNSLLRRGVTPIDNLVCAREVIATAAGDAIARNQL